jgi:hypothetical protein
MAAMPLMLRSAAPSGSPQVRRAKMRSAVIVGAFLLVAATVSTPSGVHQVLAQANKGKGKAPAKPAPASQPAAAPTKTEPDTASSAAAPAMTGRGEAKTAPPPKTSGDAGVTVSQKGDGGVKQFRFTETDIEGRLKAPQLVYFLRRVRAEFAAGDLGHRSFMRELSETQRDPNF